MRTKNDGKSKRDILYSVALAPDGTLAQAASADRRAEHMCPGCAGPMVLRRSQRVGKGSKRPHFAHKCLTPNCQPETVLHKLFKESLAAHLTSALERGEFLPFSWTCRHCDDVHEDQLLRRVARVAVEHHLGEARPDIALLTEAGETTAALEVVVTHRPDENTAAFYDRQGIPVVEYELLSDTALAEVAELAVRPTTVSLCRNPRCPKCGKHQHRDKLMIIEGTCWKKSCGASMKVAVVRAGWARGTHGGPETFTPEERAIAEQQGVVLRHSYSWTAGERYLANVCSACGAFAGSHYLFTQYASPAQYGELPFVEIPVGYRCDECDYGADDEDDTGDD